MIPYTLASLIVWVCIFLPQVENYKIVILTLTRYLLELLGTLLILELVIRNIHPSYTNPILKFRPFVLDKIFQMLKLSNGTIALASDDREISIWNLTEVQDNQVMDLKLSNGKNIVRIIEIKNNKIVIGQKGMLSSFDYIYS